MFSSYVNVYLPWTFECVVDKQKGPGRLMTKGLTLIVVGHVNFILGAIVHGSVLRHISKPSGKISTEYTVSNIIAVTSGLLVCVIMRCFVCCILPNQYACFTM